MTEKRIKVILSKLILFTISQEISPEDFLKACKMHVNKVSYEKRKHSRK